MASAFSPGRAKARSCLAFAALTLAGCGAFAADGILLPSPPVGPGGEDAITTSEGVRCSQSINSSGGYLDFGVAGGDLSSYPIGGATTGSNSAIGYARIIVPIGGAPKRLDCARLYDLEIARLKAEIELLKVGLE